MPTLGNLTVDLRLLSAKFEQGLDRAQGRMKRFSKGINTARASLAGFSAVLSGVGFTRLVSESISTADSIAKVADSAGIGIERLQSLRFAAEQSGVSAEQLDDGMRRLNRRLGLFISDGGGPAADAFRRLGLEGDIAGGRLRNTEAVFDRAVQSLKSIESQAERSAIASQLFGEDAGPKLALLLNKGAQGIGDLESQARELGLVLDREVVRNAEEANDKFNILSKTISTKLTAAVVDNADALGTMADAFGSVIDGAAEVTREVSRAGEAVAAFFNTPTGDFGELQEIERKLADLDDMLGSSWANRTRLFSEKGGFFETFTDEDIRTEMRRLEARRREILKAQDFAVPTGFAGLEGGLAVGIAEAEKRQEEYLQSTREGLEGTRSEIKATGEFWKTLNDLTEDGFAQMRDLAQEGRDVFDSTRTPAERLNLQITRLNDLLEAGAISWDTYARAVFDAQDQMDAQSGEFGKVLKEQEEKTEDLKSITDELNVSFNSAFEDAIVDGKKFSEVLKDIAKDLLRLFIRRKVTEPLFDAFDGFLNPSGGGKAIGGPVKAGTSYLVGERGPEVFTPSSSGQIIANNRVGGNTYNIDARGAQAGVSQEILLALQQTEERAVRRSYTAVQDDIARNGPIRRAL